MIYYPSVAKTTENVCRCLGGARSGLARLGEEIGSPIKGVVKRKNTSHPVTKVEKNDARYREKK
jgi:hypothetical protein